MPPLAPPPPSQTRFHPDFNKEVVSVVFSVRFSRFQFTTLFNNNYPI